jgi:hypothetical protein
MISLVKGISALVLFFVGVFSNAQTPGYLFRVPEDSLIEEFLKLTNTDSFGKDSDLLERLRWIGPRESLLLAKRTKVLLRKALNKYGRRLDKEEAGHIRANGRSSQWMFSLTLLGGGKSYGSVALNGTLNRSLDSDVFLFELLSNPKSLSTAVLDFDELETQGKAVAPNSVFRSIRAYIKQKPEILVNSAGFIDEIVPLRSILVEMLDYLEETDRAREFNEADNDEYLRIVNWARSTKVIANVATPRAHMGVDDLEEIVFNPMGVKTISLYSRQELNGWWQRNYNGQYLPHSVGVLYGQDAAGNEIYFVDGSLYANGVKISESYLGQEGVHFLVQVGQQKLFVKDLPGKSKLARNPPPDRWQPDIDLSNVYYSFVY